MPFLGIAIAVCFAVFALLAWSSRMTDQIAVDQLEQRLALVLSKPYHGLMGRFAPARLCSSIVGTGRFSLVGVDVVDQ
jgi:hypothetical protein